MNGLDDLRGMSYEGTDGNRVTEHLFFQLGR